MGFYIKPIDKDKWYPKFLQGNFLNFYVPHPHRTDHWSFFPCNCHRYKKLFLEPLCCPLPQFTTALIIIMFEYSGVVLIPFFCLVLVLEYQGSGTFPCLMRLYQVGCFGKYKLSELTTKAKLDSKYSSLMFKIDPYNRARYCSSKVEKHTKYMGIYSKVVQ